MGPPWRLASESAMLSEAAPVYIPARGCQLGGETARRREEDEAVPVLATIPVLVLEIALIPRGVGE